MSDSLGFSNFYGKTYVYCNRTNNCLWYMLGAENVVIPITQRSLTGYIRAIVFEAVERTVKRQKKQVTKMHLHIDAGNYFILEAGEESNFSRGAMIAIASLTPEQLMQPLTLAPMPSEKDEAILFCNCYQGGDYVRAHYNENTDWQAVAEAAIANIKQANPGRAWPAPKTESQSLAQDTSDDAIGSDVDRQALIGAIDGEMKRLGWTKNRGVDYLKVKYQARKRSDLSDAQLEEFAIYLSEQDTPEAIAS